MAYTVTKNPDGDVSVGSLNGKIVTLQPAVSDYPSGGYALVGGETANTNGTPSSINVDLWRILTAVPLGGQGGLTPTWNPATQKIQIFGEGPNPGVPLGIVSTLAAKSTNIAVASNVITVTIANSLVAGQFVYLQSFTAGGALNGLIVQVSTASATQFTANYPTANITSTADTTGVVSVVGAGVGNLLATGTSATITNSLATTSLLTMTCANSFVPGQFVVLQGLVNGAVANGVIVQILTASATQFTANWTGTAITTGAETTATASLLVTSNNAPVVANDIVYAISNSLATASAAGTAGVITLTSLQGLQPGNIGVVQGLTNGAGVNGDLLVVNQASLTQKQFVANHPTAAFTTAADSGTFAVLTTGTPTGLSSSAGEVQAGTDLSAYAFQLLLLGY